MYIDVLSLIFETRIYLNKYDTVFSLMLKKLNRVVVFFLTYTFAVIFLIEQLLKCKAGNEACRLATTIKLPLDE